MKGAKNPHEQAREDVLQELFRHASPRKRPPSGGEREIRESLHAQWSAMTQRRKMKRRSLFAAAASVAVAAIAATAILESPEAPVPGTPVAEVLLTRGHASISPRDGSPGNRLSAGDGLATGGEVKTAPGGGLALRWHSGITLRLDQESHARLLSPTRAELLAGRIYVDTSDGPTAELSFKTPAGPVRHEGTRYMVGVISGTTSLSVREGRVLLGEDGASAGEQLIVSATGEQRREAIEPYGEQWAWTEHLVTPIETDGRTVAELLAWAGMETGRSVEYASNEARRLAEQAVMHGDIGREPKNVLKLIMETTDLKAEISDGVIVVAVGASP